MFGKGCGLVFTNCLTLFAIGVREARFYLLRKARRFIVVMKDPNYLIFDVNTKSTAAFIIHVNCDVLHSRGLTSYNTIILQQYKQLQLYEDVIFHSYFLSLLSLLILLKL